MKTFGIIRSAIATVTVTAVLGTALIGFQPGGASAGSVTSTPRVEQLCVGSGEEHKCLYCISGDGFKHCYWLKVPEPKGNASGTQLNAGSYTVEPGSSGR